MSPWLCARNTQNDDDFAQNGWFVGFTPRRNPEIIVCVLFEGGEHGKLAARLATQVIKAYVDKQNRQPTKMAKDGAKVDVGALWTAPDEDGKANNGIGAGHFAVEASKKKPPIAAAAPGLQ